MADKKKPKDLNPKAKGAKVKGGTRVPDSGGRKKLINTTLKRADRLYRDVKD